LTQKGEEATPGNAFFQKKKGIIGKEARPANRTCSKSTAEKTNNSNGKRNTGGLDVKKKEGKKGKGRCVQNITSFFPAR